MRILSAAKLGKINRNEIRNDSTATTFTPLVSLIFRDAHGTVDTLRHGRHRAVKAFNPYWDKQGKTFEDPDGYRVVLQNARWSQCQRDEREKDARSRLA